MARLINGLNKTVNKAYSRGFSYLFPTCHPLFARVTSDDAIFSIKCPADRWTREHHLGAVCGSGETDDRCRQRPVSRHEIIDEVSATSIQRAVQTTAQKATLPSNLRNSVAITSSPRSSYRRNEEEKARVPGFGIMLTWNSNCASGERLKNKFLIFLFEVEFRLQNTGNHWEPVSPFFRSFFYAEYKMFLKIDPPGNSWNS